jgi:hypothetical protein
MHDLDSVPQIQLRYLKQFISKNEEIIKKIIHESEYVYERKEQAMKYQAYLIRYISLLSLSDENG